MSEILSVDEFLKGIRLVVGEDSPVPLHIPDISEVERDYVNQCLDSTYVSTIGPFVTQFEDEIAAYTGAKSAIAVSNGTSALQVALVLAGVKPGDEVIVPALSFVATANAVSHAGAFPYFADSEPDTFGLSVDSVRIILQGLIGKPGNLVNPETGRPVSAIVPMHTLGHPAKINELVFLANEFGIPVVEDAAESLGSFVGDQHTGTFGRLGVFSFNGNKTITTGGGGMIITNDEELGARAKHLTTTAKKPHPWMFFHDEIGWNYRLPNINAALGVAQMTRLPLLLKEKRKLALKYSKVFETIENIRFVEEPKGTKSNYWLSSVELVGATQAVRDKFLKTANMQGIQVRPLWELLSDLPMYRSSPRSDLNHAKNIQKRVISLPSSPALARLQ